MIITPTRSVYSHYTHNCILYMDKSQGNPMYSRSLRTSTHAPLLTNLTVIGTVTIFFTWHQVLLGNKIQLFSRAAFTFSISPLPLVGRRSMGIPYFSRILFFQQVPLVLSGTFPVMLYTITAVKKKRTYVHPHLTCGQVDHK